MVDARSDSTLDGLTADVGVLSDASSLDDGTGASDGSEGEETVPSQDVHSIEEEDTSGPMELDVVIDKERSLAWTDAEVLGCGLACIMSKISHDGHGGRLLKAWFERFSTTFHSERLGPLQLLESTFEGPAEEWDLSALPFKVTAIHNRIDLRTETDCGEFRISMASMDPILKPFHLIFLFRQPDDGEGCASRAMDWSLLSDLDEAGFHDAAHALVEAWVGIDTFIAAETVEFIVAPWEWRQWFAEPSDGPLPWTLENRPLFQTVDTVRLNKPGPERDAFLTWVEENASALDSRNKLIPEEFRPFSARVNQGVPWVPLDLTGVDEGMLETYPNLRQHIEMVGCPGCHTADAEFVQTLPDSSFSDFYKKELEARETFLHAVLAGNAPKQPFGPLQEEPVLTP